MACRTNYVLVIRALGGTRILGNAQVMKVVERKNKAAGIRPGRVISRTEKKVRSLECQIRPE